MAEKKTIGPERNETKDMVKKRLLREEQDKKDFKQKFDATQKRMKEQRASNKKDFKEKWDATQKRMKEAGVYKSAGGLITGKPKLAKKGWK